MLNEALRLIRKFHDLKQSELADRLDISRSHISEIEKGVKTPSLELVSKYSDEFNIPVSSIMFFAEELPAAQKGARVKRSVARKIINFLKLIDEKAGDNGD